MFVTFITSNFAYIDNFDEKNLFFKLLNQNRRGKENEGRYTLKQVDEEFSLREKGFTAVAVVSFGYRTETDFNTPDKTPKSRLPQEEIFTII